MEQSPQPEPKPKQQGKLTADQQQEILRLYEEGRKGAQLARDYRVSRQAIDQLIERLRRRAEGEVAVKGRPPSVELTLSQLDQLRGATLRATPAQLGLCEQENWDERAAIRWAAAELRTYPPVKQVREALQEWGLIEKPADEDDVLSEELKAWLESPAGKRVTAREAELAAEMERKANLPPVQRSKAGIPRRRRRTKAEIAEGKPHPDMPPSAMADIEALERINQETLAKLKASGGKAADLYQPLTGGAPDPAMVKLPFVPVQGIRYAPQSGKGARHHKPKKRR